MVDGKQGDITGFECKTALYAAIFFLLKGWQFLATQMHTVNLTEINEIVCGSMREKDPFQVGNYSI